MVPMCGCGKPIYDCVCPTWPAAGKLIGLGGFKGSGKSVVSGALVERGWSLVKFAGPLKAMAGALFETVGLDAESCIDGDLKETSLDALNGFSPRDIMVTLGTEWGRETLDADFWTDLAVAKIKSELASGKNVIIDDVRFDNEADLIRDLGGHIVNVVRKGIDGGTHISERGVVSDFDIHNDADKARLIEVAVFALDN